MKLIENLRSLRTLDQQRENRGFLRALGLLGESLQESYTYNLLSNPFTLFGFFWGIPVPAFFLYFHWSLTSEPLEVILSDYWIHWVFMLHPVLFALFFGAVGNIYFGYHRKLKYRATHDELTSLLNHTEFYRITKRYLSELHPETDTLSLILCDLDHFKRVNDSLGHKTGDDVLKTIASIIETATRSRDYPCRYGGEEFAVVLPDTSTSNAYTVAERIRRNVASSGNDLPKWLTLSAGVAGYPDDGTTVDELINVADRKLYQAKSEGRNRTM